MVRGNSDSETKNIRLIEKLSKLKNSDCAKVSLSKSDPSFALHVLCAYLTPNHIKQT